MERTVFNKTGLPAKQVIAMFLLMGLLISCESTGRHISSTTSEELASGEIVPPVVAEEEVVEPVVEEIEVAPFTEEPVAQAVESSEEVPQDVSKDIALAEPPAQEKKQADTSASSAPKPQPSLPSPQAPISVNPPQIDLAEPVQPKRLQDIYFDFDQAVILDTDKPILEANGALLKGHFKHLSVLVEGHCDERGSVEYNLVLGVRRAQVVKAYLIDLGIPDARIRIVSYGKERPVCTQQNDTCWQKNRRAHFVLQ